MSDKRADAMPVAQMTPTTASEKLARFQLLREQIEASDSPDKEALKKAILSNMSEEEKIRNDVLLNISKYKPSTPEWYMLVSLCEGREDVFEQSEFLARQVYQAQKTEIAMSYFTPSKISVRDGFYKSAKAGSEARAKKLEEVETRTTTGKASVMTAAVASAAHSLGLSTSR